MKAVNLLPPDLRTAPVARPGRAAPAPAPSGPGALAVLGGLALALVAAVLYVLTANGVRQSEADLAAVGARQQVALQRAVALKPYADFEALAEARVATVRDLADGRFDWEQALRDLARAVPAEVTLREFNGTVSAGSGGSLRGALAVPAVELKGCTSSQGGVARLMSRLRNVDGVTRVSLVKSTKPASRDAGPGAGPAVVEPTAAATGQAPCGTKDDPPDFELVAFFEGQADKSVAPTGPASPAPAPSAAPATAGAAPAASATPAPAAPAATSASASTTSGASAP